jgi:diaminohydroxyphosphoribosylaminopyrimidine deaminase/5-amino-6-(5-phosphoribosylamino)uracil reductase
MSANRDNHFMRQALSLANRGLGLVWPNPAVGCVLVKQERVVGRGWTQSGGRPHAEAEALIRAGAGSVGATAYVTLEPCAHHGNTPPCAEALVAAGVSRVVIAIRDPDARVAGKGIAILKAAGIEVTEDVEASAIEKGRPFVGLKVATSLDGKIATATGHSQWITGPEARLLVHQLRGQHDAILTGIGTVLADDPMLNCRLPGRQVQPVRVVLDGQLRMPVTAKMVRSSDKIQLWVFSNQADEHDLGQRRVFTVPSGQQFSIDPLKALTMLAAEGITRVMIEAGAKVAASFLSAGLVDQIYWFRGDQVIGGDGLAVFDALKLADLDAAQRFEKKLSKRVGKDSFELFSLRA